MKNNLTILAAVMFLAAHMQVQLEPVSSNWKTWFIAPGNVWCLPTTLANKEEVWSWQYIPGPLQILAYL